MTAIHERRDHTTVAQPAANGQFLTKADIAAFADELDLEGIPSDTPIAVQMHPETGRWVLIQAAWSRLASESYPDHDPSIEQGNDEPVPDPPDDPPVFPGNAEPEVEKPE